MTFLPNLQRFGVMVVAAARLGQAKSLAARGRARLRASDSVLSVQGITPMFVTRARHGFVFAATRGTRLR
jgi:hypothetical protein